MADFSGELLTNPNETSGTQDTDGYLSAPSVIHGSEVIRGEILQTSHPITYYFLTAICSTGNVRNYWRDTSVSLSQAPFCSGGYVAGSLTILGQFTL